jgi:hypothetical protein
MWIAWDVAGCQCVWLITEYMIGTHVRNHAEPNMVKGTGMRRSYCLTFHVPPAGFTVGIDDHAFRRNQ